MTTTDWRTTAFTLDPTPTWMAVYFDPTADTQPHTRPVIGWLTQTAVLINPKTWLPTQQPATPRTRVIAAVECDSHAVAVDGSGEDGYIGFWYLAGPGKPLPTADDIQARLAAIRPPLSGPPANRTAAAQETKEPRA